VHVVHIPKNHLMLIAGLVWCAAGAMVCMIGLPIEFGLAPSHLILFPLAVLIFLVFYFFVFSRLVAKHTGRIRARVEDRLPWSTFPRQSLSGPVPTFGDTAGFGEQGQLHRLF
jgi:hypothetical protein